MLKAVKWHFTLKQPGLKWLLVRGHWLAESKCLHDRLVMTAPIDPSTERWQWPERQGADRGAEVVCACICSRCGRVLCAMAAAVVSKSNRRFGGVFGRCGPYCGVWMIDGLPARMDEVCWQYWRSSVPERGAHCSFLASNPCDLKQRCWLQSKNPEHRH